MLSLSDLAALVALAVAVVAIRKADKNSSAATMVALNESFRQAWPLFLAAQDEEERNYRFHDVMNIIEIGCGIYVEGSISGVSRELIETYLGNVLSLLKSEADAWRRVELMRHSPTTFRYIYQFLALMKDKGHPHEIAAALSST